MGNIDGLTSGIDVTETNQLFSLFAETLKREKVGEETQLIVKVGNGKPDIIISSQKENHLYLQEGTNQDDTRAPNIRIEGDKVFKNGIILEGDERLAEMQEVAENIYFATTTERIKLSLQGRGLAKEVVDAAGRTKRVV